jgi:hypothetical protein
VVGCSEHGDESQGSIKGGGGLLTSSVTISFSRTVPLVVS